MTKTFLLDQLAQKIKSVDLPLKQGHNLVFGKGNPDASIMFIGEAPGEQEDLKGAPFVGSAGKPDLAARRTIIGRYASLRSPHRP